MSRSTLGLTMDVLPVESKALSLRTAGANEGSGKSAYSVHSTDTPATFTSSHRFTAEPINSNDEEKEAREKARRHTLTVVSAFMVCFTAGWGDGVTGVVLPYIKAQFALTYTLSALLFVAVSSGYVITAFTMERATNLFGRFPTTARRPLVLPILPNMTPPPGATVGFSLLQGRWFVMMAGSCIHACFFLTTAASTTFPGVLAGFCMNGFAKGNMISTLNAYMVANPNTFGLGHMHSLYCIGALMSHLICQTLIAHGWQWQNFYYLSSAIPVINLVALMFTFWSSLSEFLKDRERAVTGGISLRRVTRGVPPGTPVYGPSGVGGEDVDVELSRVVMREEQSSRHNLPRNMFMTTIKTPAVWAFGFFVSMYTGSEGVTSGYIVTYLLKMRNADPSTVGYANSAFWPGAAIGRLVLGYTAPRMGRLKPYLMFVFVVFAISFHLCIWLIPFFSIGWAMTALAGMCMGPVFPLSLEIASRNLSPAIISSALAIVSSMANLGRALYPFITGLLSNAQGEKVIEPLVISLLSTMLCFWGVTRAHFAFK